jgi:hypothetical protein
MGTVIVAALALAVVVLVTVAKPWQLPQDAAVPAMAH